MSTIFKSCNNICINGDIDNQDSLIIFNQCNDPSKGEEKDPEYLKKSNYLSEFSTESEKAKVRENLGISDLQGIVWE